MANSFIITYRLQKESDTEDQNSILQIIEKYKHKQISATEYSIFIDENPETIVDKIKPYLSKGEKLSVIKQDDNKGISLDDLGLQMTI